MRKSGHAILKSCHNCGRDGVRLRIVSTTPDSLGCGHAMNDDGARYHHIHVTAACDDCWRTIWRNSKLCQRCGSERLLDVVGKSSDTNSFRLAGRDLTECYVILGCNIGDGDYYGFVLCLDCGQVQGEWPVPKLECEEEVRLWFFVPDYPAVRGTLEVAYARFGVDEHSAEPGRTRGNPNDADVTVRGPISKVADFRAWLEEEPVIPGLQIEGEPVE